MTSRNPNLADYGWSDFFDSQREPDDPADATPARVMAVHRDGLGLLGPGVDGQGPVYVAPSGDEEAAATVGDWLLVDPATYRPLRLLRRKSLFKRRAAGSGRKLQLIAANVDTLIIVTSCNRDFNIARLERYLALALEAEVTPIIVLTKADLADGSVDYAGQAGRLLPGLSVVVVDARDASSVACLSDWCARGRTVALVGSSGVGKSTLVKTLTGDDSIVTHAAREDDDRGRHTTSSRALHRLPSGGWLLDTPGMRELPLTDVKAGIEDVFAEIILLTRACRFADCSHQTEPGCAVRAAIQEGALDADRLERWRKLAAEDVRNTASLGERRVRDRAFAKTVKRAKKAKRRPEGE